MKQTAKPAYFRPRPRTASKSSRSVKKKTKARTKPKKNVKPEATNQNLKQLKKNVGLYHHIWIEAHPQATLFDLSEYLRRVRAELSDFDNDDLVLDIVGDLREAKNYLSCLISVDHSIDTDLLSVWGLFSELQGDMIYLQLLIQEVGEAFPLKSLPQQKIRTRRSL